MKRLATLAMLTVLVVAGRALAEAAPSLDSLHNKTTISAEDRQLIRQWLGPVVTNLMTSTDPARRSMVGAREEILAEGRQDVGRSPAFQQAFGEEAIAALQDAAKKAISQDARLVDEHDDFIVINQDFTVLIQPSVPMPDGYGEYWAFRPDHRPVVDITLGVPLSNGGKYEILGYLALPRLMVPERWVRLSAGSDARIEMHGHSGLDLIRELLH